MTLLSEHEDVLAEFHSGQVAVPPDSEDAGWVEVSQEQGGAGRCRAHRRSHRAAGDAGCPELHLPSPAPQISHTFTDYGPGVRFVRFEHGGQDSVYWKGWFGARVTNSSVWVEP